MNIHSTPIINFTPYSYSTNKTFTNFIERLDNYFCLKIVTVLEAKAYMLLNTLSLELRKNVYEILSPENPSDNTFEELVEVLQNFIEPNKRQVPLNNQPKFISRPVLSNKNSHCISEYIHQGTYRFNSKV